MEFKNVKDIIFKDCWLKPLLPIFTLFHLIALIISVMVIVGINQDPYWDEEHVNYTVWLETNPAPICSKSEFKKTLVTTKKAKQCFYFNLRYNLWAWLWSNLSESTYAALPGHCAKLGRVNDKVVILSIKYCGKRFPDRSLLRCFLIPAGSPEGSKRNSLRGDEILRELKVTSLYHSFRESKLTNISSLMITYKKSEIRWFGNMEAKQ